MIETLSTSLFTHTPEDGNHICDMSSCLDPRFAFCTLCGRVEIAKEGQYRKELGSLWRAAGSEPLRRGKSFCFHCRRYKHDCYICDDDDEYGDGCGRCYCMDCSDEALEAYINVTMVPLEESPWSGKCPHYYAKMALYSGDVKRKAVTV